MPPVQSHPPAPLPSPGEFNLACRKGSAAEHAAGFLARMEEGGAGCLWVERPPLTEMLLHGITECFQNTKVLMQDGVDLFEIQVPVDMDQDIPKSRQIREIGNERFREDPLIPEDLECLPVTCRPPEPFCGDQISRNRSRTGYQAS